MSFGLCLSLDTEGLGLGFGLGLGSWRLGLVGKHFSITCIKLCLNMPLRFSLSSRLPPLLFRTTSILGMMWMWNGTSILRPSGGAVVPQLGLASWYASSRSRALKAFVSVSPQLELSMPRSRLKRPRAHPCSLGVS